MKKTAAFIGLSLVLSLSNNVLAAPLKKIKVGYYGGTCEAAVYIAKEKGFFTKNGLDAELIAVNGDVLKEGIATGKLDAVQLSPGNFKPIEQGLNIKITSGIHSGCIQSVVLPDSPIKSLKDLKGKTIGVDAIGGVPMVLLSVELGRLGIDPKTEVNWRAYPSPQLQQALKKHAIDAYATWDPFGELSIAQDGARRIFSSTHDRKYKSYYCCFTGINGDLVAKQPNIARAITKAINEASSWVADNPKDAAKILIDKKYTAGDAGLNAKLISDYHYGADSKRTKESLEFYFKNLKTQGIFDQRTDPGSLVKKVFTQFK